MKREVISDKQCISLMVMFILGTASMFMTATIGKRDFLLGTILALFLALLMTLVYARLHSIFKGKDLFDILQIVFGKIIGKCIGILYIWFVFHTGALILRDVGEFIINLGIPETPMIVPIILITFLCIWVAKEGIEVLGRWSEFFIPIIVVLVFIIIILLIPKMDINNVRPIFNNEDKLVWIGAFEALGFPFLETIAFTMVFSKFKLNKSPYKIYISSLLIGGIILLLISITDVCVLGLKVAIETYYPTYATMSRLKIAGFLQGMEIVLSFALLLGGFIKISIYLLATCRGISKVCRFKDYRFIVVPIALIMMNLSYFHHDNIESFFKWYYDIWTYYALFFQIIIPIILLIVAEIKLRRKKLGSYNNE